MPGREPRPRRTRSGCLAGLIVAGSTAAAACSGQPSDPTESEVATVSASSTSNASDEWPITECGTFDGRGCAPTDQRVDLDRPSFADPTRIDNPLFPVSSPSSVIQVGRVDGLPFRSETTTLPETEVIDWYGTEVEVVLSQYVAYLDGEITEVAIDRYAQADDGSVWYFGEDVIDYRDGAAYLTEGTWLAGRDGPPAMVMPAQPDLGDVYRVELVIGIVFEELTVVETDATVAGPEGPVSGAIVVDELGVDGGHSRKTLAPGYGEFLTRSDGEIEAVAVATPVNAVSGGVPAEIRKILTAAWGCFESVRMREWEAATASVQRIRTQLDDVEQTAQPPRVMSLLERAVVRLDKAVSDRDRVAGEQATVDVAQSAIDLEARYLDPADVEVARFHLHAQQLRVDAAVGDRPAVMGQVAVLEWIRDRVAGGLDDSELAAIDDQLTALRGAAGAGALASAADIATRLASDLRSQAGAAE